MQNECHLKLHTLYPEESRLASGTLQPIRQSKKNKMTHRARTTLADQEKPLPSVFLQYVKEHFFFVPYTPTTLREETEDAPPTLVIEFRQDSMLEEKVVTEPPSILENKTPVETSPPRIADENLYQTQHNGTKV